MQIFVGTLITTISILIIGLLIWYNHFYMFAFGRGLPETLFYQRMIATLIPSAPFIVFIYLVFKHPIFGNNDEKETPIKKKWSLARIAMGFVCVCILWPWPSGVLINLSMSDINVAVYRIPEEYRLRLRDITTWHRSVGVRRLGSVRRKGRRDLAWIHTWEGFSKKQRFELVKMVLKAPHSKFPDISIFKDLSDNNIEFLKKTLCYNYENKIGNHLILL